MSKKKIITLVLVALIAVISITSVTLAYLTDSQKATNTFTIGNVKIKLIEQQRGEDGLEEFQQNKKLLPVVGKEKDVLDVGKFDGYGLPTAKNYVDKMVSIKNTGSEKAYIRAYFAVPAALDSLESSQLTVLHFHFGTKAVNGRISETFGKEWIWMHNGKWNYFETTMDGIKYRVYYADYYRPLEKDETTERLVNGIFLDESFDMKEDGAYAFGKKLVLDEGWDWSNVSCPVYAVATQAEGFDNATTAIEAAFNAKYNPWGTEVTNWNN